jgi:hypothetical protein
MTTIVGAPLKALIDITALANRHADITSNKMETNSIDAIPSLRGWFLKASRGFD